MERRRFKQTKSLEERLIMEARRAREEAERMPPGRERDLLMRKARHAESGAEWLTSLGLQRQR
jgi:hypothetical protein